MPTLIEVRDTVNDWLAARWSIVTDRQAAYYATHRVYFQGLLTHLIPPEYTALLTGAIAPSNLDANPTDQIYTWDDFMPELRDVELPCALRFDVYQGPLGDGYIATVFVAYNGYIYARSQNVGPETWRSVDWYAWMVLETATIIKAIVVGPDISTATPWDVRRLIGVGQDYALYQVDATVEEMLDLHALLWAMTPAQTLGALAVVQVFGTSFYASAVRTATGMTLQQAAQRRDRIAAYLESLGYTNTAALRAAVDENAQMLGIVTALGYTAAQMWGAMTP